MGRHRLARACDNNATQKIFIKTARIESLPSRIRVSLGLRRRSGIYDWPLAELHNNVNARLRTDLIPNLIGYGFKHRLGLVDEVFLAYEHLEGHMHGLEWVRRHKEKVADLVRAALNLISNLNHQGIYHLDLWAANIMLRPDGLDGLKAIDLENCFIGTTPHHSETLGFQYGFLYQYALNEYITEEEFDALVANHLMEREYDIDQLRFLPFYDRFKTYGQTAKIAISFRSLVC
ncbi:hypothetical protein D7241_13715 [Stutzerimonas sp. VN223-3]|uniref:hypothetical protein n=1 Tax=Stutzerimonas sp. VN223-3 TaxID=3384601 RepID=UPI0038B4D365